MEQIRIMRSFVAGEALGELVAKEYDLGAAVYCKLFSKMLRTQDNDHYLIMTGDGRKYVARVYQQGDQLGRQQSDYQYELDWLNFLKNQGVPVAYPIPMRDGRHLGSVIAPEGKRYYALFSFANGKPMSLNNEEQLYRCGAEIARIHQVSNDFKSDQARQAMDLGFLVDRSVARLKRFWENEAGNNLDLIVTSAAEAKEEIEALLSNEEFTEDSWGPIGGDFHSANTYFDQNGNLTFFNFDLCGPGWRAYDIASFLLNTNLMHAATDLSEAFFAGYYSVRQLSQNEHAAISPFLTIRRIWLTGAFTLDEGMAGHTFIAPAKPR